MGPPNFDVFQEAWPNNDRNLWFGIYDGVLYDVIEGGALVLKPSVASSWSMDDKALTLKIRQDVPWHDTKYGNLTVDDIMFSWTRASAAGTKWTRADVFTTNWQMDKMSAPDKETIVLPWKTKDARWATVLRDVELNSKKQFDDKGADYQNVTGMGTGPFKLKAMVADDSMTLEAVPSHWRETSNVATVKAFQVPEEAARIAMIKTGEADVVQMGLQSAKAIDGLKGVRFFSGPVTGTTGAQIALTGLYYQKTDFKGAPTNRVPLTKLQWVGDPAVTDPKSPKHMDNARKVRLAMAMSIDRESLVRNILAGQGAPQYIWNFGPGHPRWTPEIAKKYTIPYDVAGAKKLLAEAGYPNGFDFEFWIPSGLTDVLVNLCQAMVPMFQAAGLNPKVSQTAYTTVRPQLLARTIDKAWCWQENGWNLDPANVLYRLNTIDVWNVGMEIGETEPVYREIYAAPTVEERWKVIEGKFAPWYYDFLPGFQTVSFVNPIVLGPKIGDYPVRLFAESYPRDLWLLKLTQ